MNMNSTVFDFRCDRIKPIKDFILLPRPAIHGSVLCRYPESSKTVSESSVLNPLFEDSGRQRVGQRQYPQTLGPTCPGDIIK